MTNLYAPRTNLFNIILTSFLGFLKRLVKVIEATSIQVIGNSK